MSRSCLVVEYLALRQQLAAYARNQKRPRVEPEERTFWVALSKVWADWRSALNDFHYLEIVVPYKALTRVMRVEGVRGLYFDRFTGSQF